MKEFIVGAALVIMLATSFVISVDINQYLEHTATFENCIVDTANGASLYFDKTQYGNGFMVFMDSDVVSAIEDMLEYTFDTNGTEYLPDFDTFEYTITIYDDSLQKRVYEDGVLDSTTPFTYGVVDRDGKGIDREIKSPTIILYVNAGHPRMMLNALRNRVSVHESAAYVYQDDF